MEKVDEEMGKWRGISGGVKIKGGEEVKENLRNRIGTKWRRREERRVEEGERGRNVGKWKVRDEVGMGIIHT